MKTYLPVLFRLYLYIMVFLCLPSFCHAACTWTGDSTATAASASRADVAACLNDARWGDGDTLIIPAAACGTQDWSAGNLTISKNNVTIQGQGYNSTCINDGGFTVSAGIKNPTVTGIKFYATTAPSSTNPLVFGSQTPEAGTAITGIHVHSNYISGYQYTVMVWNSGRGVIANNVFEGGRIYADGSDQGWNNPSTPGGSDFLFIEDNHFSNDRNTLLDHSFTSGNGKVQKTVIRCNKFTRATSAKNPNVVDFHGYGYGTNRGTRESEIYGNLLYQTSNVDSFIQIRGGTGVVFSNRVQQNGYGSSKNYLRLWNDRLSTADGGAGYHPSGSPDICSSQTSGIVYCNNLEGYSCCDQIGRGANQGLEPFYFWDNKFTTGGNLGFYKDGGSLGAIYAQDGADYYSNTQMTGYTPYTYPHPVRGLSATTTCLADSNSEAKTGISFSGDTSTIPAKTIDSPPISGVTPNK